MVFAAAGTIAPSRSFSACSPRYARRCLQVRLDRDGLISPAGQVQDDAARILEDIQLPGGTFDFGRFAIFEIGHDGGP